MAKREYKCTAATKEALLEAIIELSKEKGYEKVTIREICQKAHISIGAFYHHYHSKEDLAKEAYYQIDRLITADFVELYEKQSSLENLYSLLEIYIKYVEDEAGMIIKEYYKIMMERTDISVFNPERLYYRALKQILMNCAEDGVISRENDFTELTEYSIRFVRGLIFDWSVHDGSYDLSEQFRQDFTRLINGLGNGKMKG